MSPRAHPKGKALEFYADRGYDSKRYREFLRGRGFACRITRRRTRNMPRKNKKRIVVEHNFAWLKSNRRLILRHDTHCYSYKAFVYCGILRVIVLKCALFQLSTFPFAYVYFLCSHPQELPLFVFLYNGLGSGKLLPWYVRTYVPKSLLDFPVVWFRER